jgi:REP element-mobilizing transposase RayT
MPNHIHGILVITDYEYGSPPNAASRRRATTLPTIMRAFKSLTAVASSQVLERDSVRFWQHGYEEYLLRDADDLAYLREYIARNPAEWLEDEAYSA